MYKSHPVSWWYFIQLLHSFLQFSMFDNPSPLCRVHQLLFRSSILFIFTSVLTSYMRMNVKHTKFRAWTCRRCFSTTVHICFLVYCGVSLLFILWQYQVHLVISCFFKPSSKKSIHGVSIPLFCSTILLWSIILFLIFQFFHIISKTIHETKNIYNSSK